jgi:NADH dehydrogenase
MRDFRGKFRLGSPIDINHRDKTVKLDSSEVIPFDYLVFALGSVTNDFGTPGVQEYALGMKSISEALAIRGEIMRRFEALCRFEDDTKFHISVIGGGPTGVEMAGALAELVKGPLTDDQPYVARNIEVTLIEAGPRLLPMFSERLTDRTKSDLEGMGVKVLVSSPVKKVEWRKIEMRDGSVIPSEITIWAAGVKPAPAAEQLRLPIVGGRIEVEPTLQVKHYPYMFAIGDNSGATGEDGRFLPMIAPVAMQGGRHIAEQIRRDWVGLPTKKFKYKDKGSMATIGRHKAVVQVKKIQLTGFIAWQTWLFLHLFYLSGVRNRIGTIVDWFWNYITFDRGNRHIMDGQ